MNDYSCELRQNELSLYDLTIRDGAVIVVSVKNVSFQRALVLIEDNFHTTRRKDDG